VNQLTTKQLDKQNKELDKLTKCKYNSIRKTRTKEHKIQLDKQKVQQLDKQIEVTQVRLRKIIIGRHLKWKQSQVLNISKT